MAWKDREAMLAYNREYYAKNKSELLKKQKAWRERNKARVAEVSRRRYLATRVKAAEQRKARYRKNREIERQQQAAYREANRSAIRDQQQAYRAEHREELKARARERRAANPEAYRAKDRARRSSVEARAAAVVKTRQWIQKNKERHLQWMRERRKQRVASDPIYKLSIAMRRRFYMAVRNQVYDGWDIRSGEAVWMLGCSMAEFVAYIESLWSDGMTWGNWTRDGWHIDHIIPFSAFDMSDESQRRAACHYTNLRPLWAKDNLRKGAKVDASVSRKGKA